MLIIKIMSAADLADSDPGKEFKLISDVISVSFTTDDATEYEKTMLGYESVETPVKRKDERSSEWQKRWAIYQASRGEDLTVSFAKVTVADPLHPNGKREETHLLTGNCYVLNDRGKTIESFWARRTPTGELVSE